MREREPQPDLRAARWIARLLGPVLVLALLVVWSIAWLRPQADAERFAAAQQAGRVELPAAPLPDTTPGTANRALDPDDRDRTPPPKPVHPPSAVGDRPTPGKPWQPPEGGSPRQGPQGRPSSPGVK